MSAQPPIFFADLDLSRRLERTEAQSNIDFVEARARAFPESNARWTSTAGAFAMYDGVDSPLTQTFCLGIFEPATVETLDQIQSFFAAMGAPVFHEVSPLADNETIASLNRRDYQPFEFTSVMFKEIRDLGPSVAEAGGVRTRIAGPDELDVWAEVSARGWSETEGLSDFMLSFGRVSARKTSGHSFLAERDGRLIGAGGLTIHEGTALFAGASTVPEFRRQGAQTALLDARLRFAREQGCDLAMMCALPGSASQRNAERHGFKIAYTRAKWRQKSQTAG